MKQILSWNDFNENDAYLECSEWFSIISSEKYSLSAVKTARIPSTNTCGYLRDCDAICDIKVYGNIKSIKMMCGDSYIESKYENGEWDISKLFTMDNPLIVAAMSWSTDYLEICAEEKINITWKKIRYTDKCNSSRNLHLVEKLVKYNNCVISYYKGTVLILKNNDPYMKFNGKIYDNFFSNLFI